MLVENVRENRESVYYIPLPGDHILSFSFLTKTNAILNNKQHLAFPMLLSYKPHNFTSVKKFIRFLVKNYNHLT